MAIVRLGIIGLGNIGKHHAAYLAEGQVKDAVLAAVCDVSPERTSQYGGVRGFSDPHDLMHSGCVDALLIATPHFQHVPLGISAIEHGLHIMVEKPIAAHKADAERLIAAHKRHPGVVFAGMFQFRIEPRYVAIKEILEGGLLGKLQRVSWIMTDWYRTEAYYASGGWRATWKGEGGGVLLNQCLHNLDTLQWLLGMPRLVRGFCKLGKRHDIEVEDEAVAYFEYPDGATGTLVTSTGESPGTNRLEIAGTRGKLLLENDRLILVGNREDAAEFSRTSPLGFAKPESEAREIRFGVISNAHRHLTQNFVNAINGAESLVAPGEHGINSVEFANAILFSSLKGTSVELPLDSAAYESLLDGLIAGSTREKVVVKALAEDITASFRK